MIAAALSLVFSLILALNFFERYREASLMGDEYICIAEPVCDPESNSSANYGNTWKDTFVFAVFCFALMMITSVLIIFQPLVEPLMPKFKFVPLPTILASQFCYFVLLILLTIFRFNDSGMICAAEPKTGTIQILNVFNDYNGLPDQAKVPDLFAQFNQPKVVNVAELYIQRNKKEMKKDIGPIFKERNYPN